MPQKICFVNPFFGRKINGVSTLLEKVTQVNHELNSKHSGFRGGKRVQSTEIFKMIATRVTPEFFRPLYGLAWSSQKSAVIVHEEVGFLGCPVKEVMVKG